jgi:hypothetical protein
MKVVLESRVCSARLASRRFVYTGRLCYASIETSCGVATITARPSAAQHQKARARSGEARR